MVYGMFITTIIWAQQPSFVRANVIYLAKIRMLMQLSLTKEHNVLLKMESLKKRLFPLKLLDVKERSPLLTKTRRSEEHTSELQSLMRISYTVFCLKKK